MSKAYVWLGVFGAAACLPAAAAEWTPEITLGILHTDNVELSPTDPESTRVWELIPSLSVEHQSRRLVADAAVRLEAYHYADRGNTEVFKQFQSALDFALAPEHLFLQVGGSRTQTIVNPEERMPIGNLAISQNRADLDEYYAGPAFRIGSGDVVLSGALRRTWVRYDQPIGMVAQDDYDYDTANIGIDNYRHGRGLTWAFGYDYQKATYETLPIPYEYRQASAELGFWANEGTRVFVAGGKESPWDMPLDPGLRDSFWEAGLAVSASDRWNAELAAGERSFGRSHRASFDYSFRENRIEVIYSALPTSNAADRFARGGLLDPDEPNDYLFRPGTLERFIQKRLQAQLNFDLRRFDIEVTAFDEVREERAQVDGTPLPEESQKGADVAFTWNFGRRLNMSLRGSDVERVLAFTGESSLKLAAFETTYELGSRTRLAVAYEKWTEKSVTLGVLNYRATVVTAAVTRTFARQ